MMLQQTAALAGLPWHWQFQRWQIIKPFLGTNMQLQTQKVRLLSQALYEPRLAVGFNFFYQALPSAGNVTSEVATSRSSKL